METAIPRDDYENLLTFIEETSEAEADINFQEVVLSKLKEHFNFTHSDFVLYNPDKNIVTYPVTMNLSKNLMDEYYGRWSQNIFFDPFFHYIHIGADAPTDKTPMLIVLNDFMSPNEWSNSEYYSEYIKKQGLYTVAAIPLYYRNGFIGAIGLLKEEHTGAFTHREKYIMRRIGLQISYSLENYLSVNRCRAEKQFFQASLGELNVGTILLDRNCKVTYFNKAADKLCTAIFKDETSDHFNKLLNYLNANMVSGLHQTKVQLNLRDLKFSIEILPLIFTSEYRTMESRYVIYIRNLTPGSSNIDHKLSELYKLSKRELEVIQLILEGLDNTAIANKLYLSSHTVKTHIQNIFMKMKINNRASIIRIINEMKQAEADQV